MIEKSFMNFSTEFVSACFTILQARYYSFSSLECVESVYHVVVHFSYVMFKDMVW